MSGGKMEWNAIHQRLEAISTAIEKGQSPGPGDRERILEARAEVLAREPEETKDKDSFEIVEFLLANEYYGIESRYIREVYPIKNYTPLPGTPSFVLGLINVRGQIVSVIDIKKFFDMPDKGISDLNKAIIIRDDTMEFGILTDEILGVREVMRDELQAAPTTFSGVLAEYILGVGDGHMIILDAQKMMRDKKVVVCEEVT